MCLPSVPIATTHITARNIHSCLHLQHSNIRKQFKVNNDLFNWHLARNTTGSPRQTSRQINLLQISYDFDRALSLICGNKMPTRCNRGFYCRSYCLLNMFRASLCPSSGAQGYYTVVAPCVVFRAVVFKLLVWCGAEGYVSSLQDAQHPANRTHNPQLHTRPAT